MVEVERQDITGEDVNSVGILKVAQYVTLHLGNSTMLYLCDSMIRDVASTHIQAGHIPHRPVVETVWCRPFRYRISDCDSSSHIYSIEVH